MDYKLFRCMFTSEKLILYTLVSLYLTLELLNIKLPGLYADEAMPACGSLQIIKNIGPIMPSFRIFNIDFPLMSRPYLSALESYILLPFFWIFGINIFALRLAPIVINALSIVFTYLFLKELFDKNVGLFTIFLLVINSIFLFETKLGLNSASILHFTGMTALWCLFRWYKGKGDIYFYSGIFLLSLGIATRVWFLWFINGMILSAIIFNKELGKRINGNICKYIITSFITFSLGSFLFIYYNFKTKFDTIRYAAKHFTQTSCLVNNLNYLHNLNLRFYSFIDYLNGKRILMRGTRYSDVSLGEISTNYLFPYVFLGAFTWLILSISFNKTHFSKKRIIFIFILFLSILLQSPFTLSSLNGPHLFILYPLIQIILGLAGVDIVRNFIKNKIIFIIISLIFFSFVFLECNNTLRNNYLYFKNTGVDNNPDSSIYSLSEYLKEKGIYEPILMDWGIYHNLIFFSQGKVIPQTFKYIEGGYNKDEFIKDEFIRDCKHKLKNNNVYVFHAPEFTDRSYVYPIFIEISKELNKSIYTEKVFYQSDRRPVFVVYSVR